MSDIVRQEKTRNWLRDQQRDPFYVGRDDMQKQLYRDPKLSQRGLRVGIALSLLFSRQEFNKIGQHVAFPGVERLAEEVGMSESSVHRAISDLERRGHFKIIKGGGRKSSRYIAEITNKTVIKTPHLRVIDGDRA